MKILFMGTPDFALFSLKALYESGEEIAAVITQPDRPVGRGYVMTPPPVKRWALENNIPVYQPKTLRDEEFASLLADIDPELIVVVAFGKILPKNVLDYPEYGIYRATDASTFTARFFPNTAERLLCREPLSTVKR